MDSEAFFYNGINVHLDIIELLTKMGQGAQSLYASIDINHSIELFDVIMQGFLFATAAADGRLIKEEYDFIRNVCTWADCVTEYNKKVKDSPMISWSQLLVMDSKTLKQFVSDLHDLVVMPALRTFVRYYPSLSLIYPGTDFAKLLCDHMQKLMMLLGRIDGDITSEEMFEDFQSLETFKREWKYVCK